MARLYIKKRYSYPLKRLNKSFYHNEKDIVGSISHHYHSVVYDNNTIFVLDEDELAFAESETANLAMLVDGRAKAFLDAYDNRDC